MKKLLSIVFTLVLLFTLSTPILTAEIILSGERVTPLISSVRMCAGISDFHIHEFDSPITGHESGVKVRFPDGSEAYYREGTTSYTYSPQGMRQSEFTLYPDGTTYELTYRYQYGNSNRLVGIDAYSPYSADHGSWEYNYDDAGRLGSIHYEFNGENVYRDVFSYDSHNNLSEMSRKKEIGPDASTKYSYNDNNQLIKEVSYEWERWFTGSRTITYSYDTAGRPIQEAEVITFEVELASWSNTYETTEYLYDNNRTWINESTKSWREEADYRGSTVIPHSEDKTETQWNYQYDTQGNLVLITKTVDGVQKLTVELAYDTYEIAPDPAQYENWQSAYKAVLAQYSEKYDGNRNTEYCVYDIDKDGVPELLVRTQTDLVYCTDVYVFSNSSAMLCNSLPGYAFGGPGWLFTYPGNGLILLEAGLGPMRVETVYLFTLINQSTMNGTMLGQGGQNDGYELAKNLGTEITYFFPVRDYSGITDSNDYAETIVPESPAQAAGNAVLSPQKLLVDGEYKAVEKYNIGGNNYFKLRDIAALLNGTPAQFSVGWDSATRIVSIVTGQPYLNVGGELVVGDDKSISAKCSPQIITIDSSIRSDLSVYIIGGNNFFKLRDLGSALGFTVDYDAATNTAIILSSQDHSASTETPYSANEDNVLSVIHYYAIIKNYSGSFRQASAYCENQGGHMATITSAEENEYVFNLMINDGIWTAYFGLSDAQEEGTWAWVTGEPLEYSNWHSGEPNSQNNTEDYAMFFFGADDSTWNDGDFNEDSKSFICEWENEDAYNLYLKAYRS